MRNYRLWHGIRMRQVAAGADPDQPQRLITIPAAWDDGAAAALAALAPGEGAVNLTIAAQAWISVCAAGDAMLDASLNMLLLARRAAAWPALWAGDFAAPGFTLNAGAFFDPENGFDVAGFAEAATTIALAARNAAPGLASYALALTGLDDLFASLGLAYASAEARATGASLAALFRAACDRGLDGEQMDLLASPVSWPWPPGKCAIPGLAEAAAAARSALMRAPGAASGAGIYLPSATDALLGVEACGLAPAFMLAETGTAAQPHLTRAARARLAARFIAPEAALAALLLGDNLLETAGLAAHIAMHEAVAPYLSHMQDRPTALPQPEGASGPARGPLPPRHASTMRKVTLGGHRVFLRTGEYEDGRVGEIALTLPGENALVRGLAESFAQAVTLGLQYGVPASEFVEALAAMQFGPAGRVEGDQGVTHAASIVDYAMRSIAAQYLGRNLPPPELATLDTGTLAGEPLLPLDLPQEAARARRRAFKVVA